ncbi:uncharacterized protein LOC116194935 [Punica granatum]|uniref:Uncharacterized protein LOC116194935 n=1 Tax=Punica granatum TaxID=22663 RepID=A0A6P8C801_PUNGR|nr:uncharacterized protein LOC116194935 [Punica granatum]
MEGLVLCTLEFNLFKVAVDRICQLLRHDSCRGGVTWRAQDSRGFHTRMLANLASTGVGQWGGQHQSATWLQNPPNLLQTSIAVSVQAFYKVHHHRYLLLQHKPLQKTLRRSLATSGMAFRSSRLWSSLSRRLAPQGNGATFATSTAPKMKAFAPAGGEALPKPSPARTGDAVPMYVAIGMIFLSVSLGLHTAMQQLRHSPTVRVKKSRRETLPEVMEPEVVADESERFLTRSFFRKIAHVQEFDMGDTVIPNPVSKDAFAHRPKVETLKSVGVDPRP